MPGLPSFLPGDLYVVKYAGDRVAHSRLALWPQGTTCGSDLLLTMTCILRTSSTDDLTTDRVLFLWVSFAGAPPRADTKCHGRRRA